MGQNNDPAERGEPQGNQGGPLANDPKKEKEIRQKDEGYARTSDKPEPYSSGLYPAAISCACPPGWFMKSASGAGCSVPSCASERQHRRGRGRRGTMTLRLIAIASVLVALGGQGVACAANVRFVVSPAVVTEITHGIDDAFACTMKYAVASAAWNCALAGERANAQMRPDHLAYDVGYYFQSWHDLDLDWTSDLDLVKSGRAPAGLADQDERATGAIYRLYRGARDRLGITDKRLLAISTMNPEGKAKALARLDFWAKAP